MTPGKKKNKVKMIEISVGVLQSFIMNTGSGGINIANIAKTMHLRLVYIVS